MNVCEDDHYHRYDDDDSKYYSIRVRAILDLVCLVEVVGVSSGGTINNIVPGKKKGDDSSSTILL